MAIAFFPARILPQKNSDEDRHEYARVFHDCKHLQASHPYTIFYDDQVWLILPRNYHHGYVSQLNFYTNLATCRESCVQRILCAFPHYMLLVFSLEGFYTGVIQPLFDASV